MRLPDGQQLELKDLAGQGVLVGPLLRHGTRGGFRLSRYTASRPHASARLHGPIRRDHRRPAQRAKQLREMSTIFSLSSTTEPAISAGPVSSICRLTAPVEFCRGAATVVAAGTSSRISSKRFGPSSRLNVTTPAARNFAGSATMENRGCDLQEETYRWLRLSLPTDDAGAQRSTRLPALRARRSVDCRC